MENAKEKRKILMAEAALQIISEKGLRGFTTANLAQRLGMSEGNIYKNFKSKDEIIINIITNIGKNLQNNLDKALQSKGDYIAKLEKCYLLHLGYLEACPGVPRLVFSEDVHVSKPEIKQTLLKTIEDFSKRLLNLFKKARKSGELRKDIKAEFMVQQYLGSIQILVFKWSLNNFSFSLTDQGRKNWKMLIKCLNDKNIEKK